MPTGRAASSNLWLISFKVHPPRATSQIASVPLRIRNEQKGRRACRKSLPEPTRSEVWMRRPAQRRPQIFNVRLRPDTDSRSYIIGTNAPAIVYNRARHAKPGDLLHRGRWGGHNNFESPGQAERLDRGDGTG